MAADRGIAGRPRTVLTVALPAVGAALVTGFLLWSASWGAEDASLLFGVVVLLWNLLPFAAMAALLWVGRGGRRAVFGVAVAGSVVVLGLTVAALVDLRLSESSTGPLLFLFLPFYLLAALAVLALVLGGVAALSRRAARSTVRRR